MSDVKNTCWNILPTALLAGLFYPISYYLQQNVFSQGDNNPLSERLSAAALSTIASLCLSQYCNTNKLFNIYCYYIFNKSSNVQNELIEAIKNKNNTQFTTLLTALKVKVFLNLASIDIYMDILHAAISDSRIEMIEQILNVGAKIDAKNTKGLTLLAIATSKGHTEAVQLLLDNGAKCDPKDTDNDQNSLLHRAAWAGSRELILFFLYKGFEINAKNAQGLTPLAIATKKDHTQAAQLLLEEVAKCDSKDND